ncbi:hypothetical protein [Rhizobium sp. C4]|uniref:hypothetical protein n=1 Tax=Rhizobium sp. C4 TaxID=1349800 RepID=UPI001E5C8E7C|nr:hypothetical protein [Rhizobium sp. C4]MCD2176184.1 hypothetical protein [Rhizobium sp. C4]
MLPPVNASIPAQPLTAPAIGQREARPDGPAAVGQAQVASQQPPLPTTQQGAASETLASLRQLADLLASQQVDAEDILTRLAIDFATALGEGPQPDEAPRDFSNRLAALIRQLPAATLLAAQKASNLGTLNIQPQALAAALADPASPAAARLVAMAEDPGADGLKQVLKAAIQSYEQNSGPASTAPAPNTIAAQKAAATTTGSPTNPDGTTSPATADGSTATQADAEAGSAAAPAREPARAASPDASSAARQPAAAATATARPAADTPAQAKAETLSAALQNAAIDRDDGQPTMQVLRGFNVVVTNVAARAADVLKTVAALAQQAETAQVFAPAAEATSGTAGKPIMSVQGLTPELPVEPAPVIAGKAHEAARAMEGRVIPLFSRPASAQDVETVDIDHLIRIAQQAAAKADPARLPELALAAQARLPEPVPFAQVPYPFVREDEEKRHRRGFGEQAGGDDEGEELKDENGQSLWHGDGEQAERREEPEIEEHPFEAEEPLKRNPTDAERALHMYQRFGGF